MPIMAEHFIASFHQTLFRAIVFIGEIPAYPPEMSCSKMIRLVHRIIITAMCKVVLRHSV